MSKERTGSDGKLPFVTGFLDDVSVAQQQVTCIENRYLCKMIPAARLSVGKRLQEPRTVAAIAQSTGPNENESNMESLSISWGLHLIRDCKQPPRSKVMC